MSRADGMSLTALFKRGETKIDDYVSRVNDFFADAQYHSIYQEKML
jgi:hypothetical protein